MKLVAQNHNMICDNTVPSAQGGKSQAKTTGLLVS